MLLKLVNCILCVAILLCWRAASGQMSDTAFAVGSTNPKEFEAGILPNPNARAAFCQTPRRNASAASGQAIAASGQDQNSASDVESVGVESRASTNATCALVPIMWRPGEKVAQCFLCGIRSDAPSPLKSGHELDNYGGLVPWPSYTKVYDDEDNLIGKTPKGKQCLISVNCFSAIGYDVKYGTGPSKKGMDSYKKLMPKKEGVDIHTNFLASQKQWIQTHNTDGPSRMGLKRKEELTQVHKRLEVHHERKGGFHAPKKQFVTEHAWDEKIDGKWDPDKAVDSEVFGVMRKGIWKNIGREGVFEYDEYDGKTHKQIVVEEDGVGKLVEQAIANKSAAIIGSFDARSAQIAAKAMDAQKMDLRALLGLIGEDGAVSDQAGASSTPLETATAVEGSDVSSGGDSASDDGALDSRLSGYFGGPAQTKTVTKNAGNAKTKKTPKAGGSAGELPLHSPLASQAPLRSFTKLGPSAVAPSIDSIGSQNESERTTASGQFHSFGDSQLRPAASGQTASVLRLDGRGVRISESVAEFLATSQKQLGDLRFDFKHEQAALAGDSLASFQKDIANSHKMLLQVRSSTKDLEKRIDKSVNKTGLAK